MTEVSIIASKAERAGAKERAQRAARKQRRKRGGGAGEEEAAAAVRSSRAKPPPLSPSRFASVLRSKASQTALTAGQSPVYSAS